MQKRSTLALICGLLCCAATAFAQTPQTTLVTSFETSADLSRLLALGAQFTATRTSVTQGQQALQVDFLPGDWPLVKWLAPAAQDWSAAAGLALDVTNTASAPVACGFTVYDTAGAWGSDHSRGGAATIPAGQTVTVFLPFAAAPPAALGLPAGSLSAGWSGSGAFDLSHIWAFNLYLHAPTVKQTLIIDNVRTVAPATVTAKLVDPYGQNGLQDWPGKLHGPAEFAVRSAQEQASLAAAPARADLDRFGGWLGGPAQPASGFFRTAQVGGQWWLVDPDGHLFFSAGVDAVRTDDGNDATFTTGREALFSALPSTNALLARHAGTASNASGSVGSTVNFYGANLERKYGPGFQSAWQQTAVARLKSWGFNTLGDWSDDALCRSDRMPYAVNLTYTGYHAHLSVNGYSWAPVDDPYDPLFAPDVAASFASGVAAYRNDPYCLGYFVGNEFNWQGYGPNARYGLALGTLAQNAASSPAKRALLAQLQTTYPTIAALNAAWGATFANWSALQGSYTAPATLTTAMQSDLAAFTLALAQRYFAAVAAALHAADPNHLYLGCRFAQYTPEVVQAAAQSCDVVSFNIYATGLDPATWGFLNTLSKPALIGEFHFGATDRGMQAAGLVDAGSQAGRAADYRAYLGSVLAMPALVGCHWYEWADEPLTGRTWDGENYGIGLVDVTDTPGPELTQAAQQANQTLYAQRAAGMSP